MGPHVRKRTESAFSPATALQGVGSPILPDAARRRFGRLTVGLVLMASLAAWLPARRLQAEVPPSGDALVPPGRGETRVAARARPFAGRARRHTRKAGGLSGTRWRDEALIEPARPPQRLGGRRQRPSRPLAHSGLTVATPDGLRRGLDRSH
ncbi:hypothetical protein [Halomonas denitrificans]|uniref:hypothetical protein n=1 Tax=Halomonas denitrificans TaxID=370769 RepID=UPI000D38D18D|nr:hypothetical protein [Halomonas denitrificans]